MENITADKLLLGLLAPERLVDLKNIIIDGVVTDSRQAGKNKLFVAIKGERADGHSFAGQTIDNGAELVLVERLLADVPVEKQVVAADNLDAMIKMGENYRSQYNVLLTAVTGSVGKTTTKEFCYAVFSAFGETLKTEGNQNNEIGMPNTLFRLSDKTQYAIIEMGMQGLGEISKLTKAAKPKAAIITGVGHSHLAQLKTRENICKAKMEICDGIDEGGFIVINADDDYLPLAPLKQGISRYSFSLCENKGDVWAKDITQTENEQSFVICDTQYGEISAKIPALGLHNVYNALSAYTLATRLGLPAQAVAAALMGYKTTGFRQNVVKCSGVTVIEDCYNANPDSMAAAIKTLAQMPSEGKKIAVLGDMLELGEISDKSHFDMGVLCAKNKINAVFAFGEQAKKIAEGAAQNGVKDVYHFTDKQECADKLIAFCKQNDTVLFKASRGMKLEEIMNPLYASLGEKA